jgi:hypothetical protein
MESIIVGHKSFVRVDRDDSKAGKREDVLRSGAELEFLENGSMN